jgi:hypothetical protein
MNKKGMTEKKMAEKRITLQKSEYQAQTMEGVV